MAKSNWKKIIDKEWLDDIEQNLVSCKTEIKEGIGTDKLLNTEFDSGYGGVEGISFIIHTEEWIYFPCCYDGAEWVERVPRNPSRYFEPTHFGGG